MNPQKRSGRFSYLAGAQEQRTEDPADLENTTVRDDSGEQRTTKHGNERSSGTQIMAFALALWAWKRGGYRKLPVPHVAWSGIPVGGKPEEWTRLAAGDFRLENALSRLHKLFRDAPDLGSLIDPSRVAEGRAFTKSGTTEMDVAGIEEVEPLLAKALPANAAESPTTRRAPSSPGSRRTPTRPSSERPRRGSPAPPP